jgi:hypothetical protein
MRIHPASPTLSWTRNGTQGEARSAASSRILSPHARLRKLPMRLLGYWRAGARIPSRAPGGGNPFPRCARMGILRRMRARWESRTSGPGRSRRPPTAEAETLISKPEPVSRPTCFTRGAALLGRPSASPQGSIAYGAGAVSFFSAGCDGSSDFGGTGTAVTLIFRVGT